MVTSMSDFVMCYYAPSMSIQLLSLKGDFSKFLCALYFLKKLLFLAIKVFSILFNFPEVLYICDVSSFLVVANPLLFCIFSLISTS